MSDLNETAAAVKEYNRHKRYKKRGVAAVLVKFGITYEALHMNQSGALVHVYRDGSVLM